MKKVLDLVKLTKQIGKKTIVDDISLSVNGGEVFGLLGPNGAGKTTTIRMIVGLISITSGDVLIDGKSIRDQFTDAIQHVGAIVENPQFYPFMTGHENLLQYARMHKGVTAERLAEVTRLVGLEKRIHEKVKGYSLGMRQRLGIAQALLHRPKILILDEPTNGLDPYGVHELRDYLRNLSMQEGVAVIISSHLLAEMELICDRYGVMQDGKLVGVGVTNEISKDVMHPVRFEVNNAQLAFEVLRDREQAEINILTPHSFEILTAREKIPKIASLLLNQEIDVFGIEMNKTTLEDRFLEMTKGGERYA